MTTGTVLKLTMCGTLALFAAAVQCQDETKSTNRKIAPATSESAAPARQVKPIVMDGTTLALKGDKISAAEAADLEQKLSQNPEDMKSLTMLLGYYSRKRFTDTTIKQKREKYILWLIANHPEAEILELPYGQLDPVMDHYPEAKKLWLEQLEKHSDDIKIVVNAAHSFSLGDPDLAIKYFEKAIKLDPKNSRMWYWQLGNMYNLKGMFGDKKTPITPKDAAAAFENALCAFENAYANSTAKEKEDSFVLKPIAEAALKAGKLDKAEEYANKMLAAAKSDKKDGNLVYYGNFVLGMVAVKKENIDAAGKYLLEAGKSIGSPQLNSFGPDMSLAQELLTKGKRDIVLEFLKECSKFWKFYGICDQLVKEMENGETPDLSMTGIMKIRMKMMAPKGNTANKDAAKPETNSKPAAQADAVKAPEIAKDNNSAAGNAFTINLATAAAEKWLALVDDGKYPESWTEAAAYFKNAVTAAAWEQSAKAVRPPFGKLLSRKVKSAVYHTSLPGAPDGRYVVIQFETSFENKKEAIETVTPMADPDGQWRVSGYYVK